MKEKLKILLIGAVSLMAFSAVVFITPGTVFSYGYGYGYDQENECIDWDRDGWGWDGEKGCRMPV